MSLLFQRNLAVGGFFWVEIETGGGWRGALVGLFRGVSCATILQLHHCVNPPCAFTTLQGQVAVTSGDHQETSPERQWEMILHLKGHQVFGHIIQIGPLFARSQEDPMVWSWEQRVPLGPSIPWTMPSTWGHAGKVFTPFTSAGGLTTAPHIPEYHTCPHL